MPVMDPEFQKILAGFDPEALNNIEHTNFGLWPDLTFSYFNDGWFRFSRENGGEPRISRNWPLGSSLLSAIPDVLLGFFTEGFAACLKAGHPWKHTYDCSSPELYRLMHQIVYPLGKSEGFLVVNSLLVELPVEEPPEEGTPDDYIDRDGIIHQCACCRRIRNLVTANRWDWIPAFVASPPHNISHGLCPICLDYYYPAPK